MHEQGNGGTSSAVAPAGERTGRGYRVPRGDAMLSEPVQPTNAPVRPNQLPKRPKGRFFVGVVLLSLVGTALYFVWDGFLRYRAYGVVDGRRIEVPVPWDGVVSHIHVREGESVRQGQLLVTLENFELEQRIAQVGDELRIAQAELDAESERIRWDAREHNDRTLRARGDYYELWGTLLRERSLLEDLTAKYQRLVPLRQQDLVTQEELDEARFAYEGQQRKVEKLVPAVEKLKQRAEIAEATPEEGLRRMQPSLLRIETLAAELRRLRELLRQGRVKAPVDGIVVRRNAFAGERVETTRPIVEIVEDGSLEVVLYVRQKDADSMQSGEQIAVVVEPNDEPVLCQIRRKGESFEPAPENIKRHYNSGERLLPVYLQPQPGGTQRAQLRLHAVAKMPYGFRRWEETP